MSKISLIHPIYLDVPMLVSFAAAIEGGLAMETEVTAESKKTNSISGKVSAKFGLSQLFTALMDTNVSAEMEGKRDGVTSEVKKESKTFTEASIAIILYHKLTQEKDYILQPKSIKDFESYSPGALVEVAGILEKNAVDAVIDMIDATNILMNMANSELPQQKNNKIATQNKAPQNQLTKIREALDKDRKRTPISNVVVRCSEPTDLNVIVTLRTENLRDLTLSELHKNSVRIVGKITRVIKEGESISSFENYGMSLLHPDLLEKAFEQITENEALTADFTDLRIKGPAFQILPLMIFV